MVELEATGAGGPGGLGGRVKGWGEGKGFLITPSAVRLKEALKSSRVEVQGSRVEVRGSRIEVRGSRVEVRGSRV